jgi:hypothetical protein
MTNEEYDVSAADIRAHDWQNVITGARECECREYQDLFQRKAVALGNAGNGSGRRVFALLAAVASFSAKYDSPLTPYGPMIQMQDRRTAVPDDLSVTDPNALAGILPEIADHEFRARAADILWLRRKDYKAAQIAVDSYLKSAEHANGDRRNAGAPL